jgi:hypothetical protein
MVRLADRWVPTEGRAAFPAKWKRMYAERVASGYGPARVHTMKLAGVEPVTGMPVYELTPTAGAGRDGF